MGSSEKTAVRIVKCALLLSLAASFLLAVYVRFYSGIVTVVDLPVWPAYLSYLAASVVVWCGPFLKHVFGWLRACSTSQASVNGSAASCN